MKKFLDGQWSERIHGKRMVAQLKWQLLLSVDSQSIYHIKMFEKIIFMYVLIIRSKYLNMKYITEKLAPSLGLIF